MPSLNEDIIRRIPLILPPLQEQRQISKILGSLDNKIEVNRRMAATLEEMAHTMFRSWFVDFDPVRAKVTAKVEGRDPERAAMAALSGRSEADLDTLPPETLASLSFTAALFPDEWNEDGVESVPQGSRFGDLTDLCRLNASSWLDKSLPSELLYVDLAGAKNGEVLEVQSLTREAAPSRARRRLRSGDTIVGTVRPGNRSFALIGKEDAELTGSTGFAVLTPKSESLHELVYLLATSEENIERLAHLADGAAYPAVRPDAVTAYKCIVPPRGIAKAFHRATAPLFDRIASARRESNALVETRDALLPRLLAGDYVKEVAR